MSGYSRKQKMMGGSSYSGKPKRAKVSAKATRIKTVVAKGSTVADANAGERREKAQNGRRRS